MHGRFFLAVVVLYMSSRIDTVHEQLNAWGVPSLQFGITIQASGSGLTKIMTILPFYLVQNRTRVSD